MTTVLHITDGGLSSTVQDAGRTGWLNRGITTAGFMDPLSAAVANALTGNRPDAPCIEFTVAGLSFRVEGAPVQLAVIGRCEVALSGSPVAPGCSFRAEAGDEVRIGLLNGHRYGYLAFGGTLQAEAAFGSHSVHVRSGTGGAALAAGDRLALKARPQEPALRTAFQPGAEKTATVRYIAGPQDFSDAAHETLTGSAWRVSDASDRMGFRLSGAEITRAQGHDISSEGIAAGSIQVPGDGQPIVLLADRQTIGGYAKIGTVLSADLAVLAQLLPGAEITFRQVSMQGAVQAARDARAMRDRLIVEIAPALNLVPSSEELLSRNLISGVTADGS